jgi:hypothetical protein
MLQPRGVPPLLCLATALFIAASCTAATAGEAEARHTTWRDCLSRNFQLQVTLATPDRAADTAFQACRVAEDAYLAALADSPLLDETDVVRARPMLASRFRAWLVRSRG